MVTVTDPKLIVHAGSEAEAVVLVLHGGREASTAPTRANQLAVIRMLPFAAKLRQHGGNRVAVARLRYRVRGWNASPGHTPDPVRDADWALDELGRRFPGLPIGLIGHSMGGRTALRVGGRAVAVAGLAPWLDRTDPVEQLTDTRVLLMHGTDDRMTSPRQTAGFTERLAATGLEPSLVLLTGEKHAMLHKPRLWHELSTQFVLSSVLDGYEPSDWPSAPNDWQHVVQATARITY